MASLLPHIAMGTPAGIEGVTRVMVEVETLKHQDCGAWSATLLCMVD